MRPIVTGSARSGPAPRLPHITDVLSRSPHTMVTTRKGRQGRDQRPLITQPARDLQTLLFKGPDTGLDRASIPAEERPGALPGSARSRKSEQSHQSVPPFRPMPPHIPEVEEGGGKSQAPLGSAGPGQPIQSGTKLSSSISKRSSQRSSSTLIGSGELPSSASTRK